MHNSVPVGEKKLVPVFTLQVQGLSFFRRADQLHSFYATEGNICFYKKQYVAFVPLDTRVIAAMLKVGHEC